VLADRVGRTAVMLGMASVSAAGSFVFGWLLGAPLAVVIVVGVIYSAAALGDSPVYSTAITEVVAPAYRGSALALRSLLGYGAGAIAPLVFGAILDGYGTRSAGAWGWAFVSLGAAGAAAVASVAALHVTPGAAALRQAHAGHGGTSAR
jgi:MFS family permease